MNRYRCQFILDADTGTDVYTDTEENYRQPAEFAGCKHSTQLLARMQVITGIYLFKVLGFWLLIYSINTLGTSDSQLSKRSSYYATIWVLVKTLM